jgi:carboxymethylenebutenolidase
MKTDRTRTGRDAAPDASRRKFLQRAATTAALAAATAAEAAAQAQPAATAAPKPVALAGRMIKFHSGTLDIPAYISRPPKKKTAPAVLVIHEVFGLNDHIKTVADRIAAAGYVALAPQFFARAAEAPPADATDVSAVRRAASLIKIEDAIKDMQAAIDFLKADDGVRPKKFASIGFCMGGGWSYQLATHSKDLAGAVVFYGSVPPELAPQAAAPVLASFGEKDARLNPEYVKTWVEAMQKAGKSVDAKVYPGAGHGFFNDTRPQAYNAEAAADAWQRTLKFFRARLGD